MAKKADPLAEVRASIDKDFGSGTLFMLGDDPSMAVERISSGNFALDLALGGGYPKGSILELFGPPGSGKSSLALMLTAQAQKLGLNAGYVDAEHAMNLDMAEACGVDVNELLFTQPSSGEQGLEITERLIEVPSMGVVVVDSVAALVPRAEIEGDFGDSHVGLQARLMSQGLRKLSATMNKTRTPTIIVFINQIREKIGGMSFGPSTTTSGGRSLPFYASTRCEVVRTKNITRGDEVAGHEIKVKVIKNRYARPFRTAEFSMLYDQGISNESGVLKLAEKHGLVAKGGGGWYADTATGEKLGQGQFSVLDFLAEHPDVMETYMIQIKEVEQ